MHQFSEGDTTKAKCYECETIVGATLVERNAPSGDGLQMVAVCDECGAVASISTGPVVAICGSMAFIDEMEQIARTLECLGCEALTPEREEHGRDWSSLSRPEMLALKKTYVDIHLDKIRRADAVLIANFRKHGIEGYVGPNTLMEAAFAYAQGIPVIFLHDPFHQVNGLECASISRGCVNGDVDGVLTLI